MVRFVVFVALLLASCGDGGDEACLTRADCAEGQICLNGGCSLDASDAALHDVSSDVRSDGAVPDGAVPDGAVPDGAVPDGILPDAALDGGADVDPCSVGPDSDGDGVVDACDVCAGFNDADDDDGDGTADGCDDWPCGIRPVIPGRVSADSISINNVGLAGMSNTAVVGEDVPFLLEFDWAIDDVDCRGCIDQVEIGFTRIGRLECVYDGNPPADGESGSSRIPGVTFREDGFGLYELRFALGRNFSCDGSNWADGEPDETHTVGAVCAPPAGIATPF